MRWWDHAVHMVWNPPASLDVHLPAKSVHLVPNTAWLAHAMLHTGEAHWNAEAQLAIGALIALQYDAPDEVFHGTYAQFLESQYPPAQPAVWVDYDPNWRQFVGTTFALILEDFASQLDSSLVAAIESSIALAVSGEPDGRIPIRYTNPALMRAWLDAWFGDRSHNAALIERGVRLAHDVVAAHDLHNAFDEFNSPTYSGIDLYAIALWTTFPPTAYFGDAGRHLARSLWQQSDEWFQPSLGNWCGPYTRSYHPNAARSVTLLSLWHWARDGRAGASLPDLAADEIDHCHDLMAGPVIARLAEAIPERTVIVESPRALRQSLSNNREIQSWITDDVMIGAERSTIDWGGWEQFMPLVVHWREPDDVGTLWLHAPNDAAVSIQDFDVEITTTQPEIRIRIAGPEPKITDGGFRVGRLYVAIHSRQPLGIRATACTNINTHEIAISGTADNFTRWALDYSEIA